MEHEADGSQVNLPRYTKNFHFADYFCEAADELYLVADLVREDGGLNL